MFTLLQAAQPGQGSSWPMFVMLGLMFLIMYFFMIRPQNKRKKELEQQRNSLQKGDKVITASGVYGKIVSLNEGESFITIEVANGVNIKIERSFVFPESNKPVQQ